MQYVIFADLFSDKSNIISQTTNFSSNLVCKNNCHLPTGICRYLKGDASVSKNIRVLSVFDLIVKPLLGDQRFKLIIGV